MALIENTQQVVSDMIDGEMMLLNMEAGNYYSLTGVGAPLWEHLRSGIEQSELLKALAAAFPQEQVESLETDLQNFLNSLREESLILEGEAGTPATPTFPQDYKAPGLDKYTDLQDLLLIDPIHEADESGWPATAS